MTRLWNEAVKVSVKTNEQGQPLIFEWNGAQHPIEECLNEWRVDTQWWRQHRWREHFKVTTTTGLLLILSHNLVDDQWYLQRLYD
jgi:hypothetical protein